MLFHHFLKLCCLALLVSCQEVPSSQPKPKYPTVAEVLCRKWIIRTMYEIYPETSPYSITFYRNHDFVLEADPEWNLGKNGTTTIKGKWEMDKRDEEFGCYAYGGGCLINTPIKLLSKDINENCPLGIRGFFNNNNINIIHGFYPTITHLSFNELKMCICSVGATPTPFHAISK